MKFTRTVLAMLLVVAAPVAEARDCTLLIVGDSLSSGYGLAPGTSWVDLLQTRLAPAGWQVINASVSGDTLKNGRSRIGPALARHQPDAVLIELGGNDSLRGAPPTAIRSDLTALVRQARAQADWVALLEAPVLPNYGKAYARAVARVYPEVARAGDARFVPCFVCDVGLQPGMMQADGIHPNEKAQPALLAAVLPHLDPALKSCR